MKSMLSLLSLLIVFSCFSISAFADDSTPLSVKLALTGQAGQMRVTWFTFAESEEPYTQFSLNYIDDPSTSGSDVQFVSAVSHKLESLGWHGVPHNSILTGLNDFTTYYYAVGDKKTQTWSAVYNFTTREINQITELSPFKFPVFGDMGTDKSNVTIEHLLERIDSYDFIYHVGDIAYADLTPMSYLNGNETVWNEFLQSIESLSSAVPYMTVPGNHDIMDSLAVYRKTFNMPSKNFLEDWYSFDYRGVHFVGISSESDYLPLSPQHIWLEEDLKSYRESNPTGWVIAFAHRPIYCSTVWNWCDKSELRKAFQYSIESLFYKYNVDLFIAGHAHNYESTLPIYDNNIEGDWSNPGATIHFVVGTGGNLEGESTHWAEPAPAWSNGLRVSSTGFAEVSLVNSTHLLFEFIDNVSNSPIFSEYIIKGQFNN